MPNKDLSTKEKIKKKAREFYHQNRERLLEENWRQHIRRQYGLTFDDYQKMLSKQEYVCKICGSNDPGPWSKRFTVDHSHQTGEIRGLLCGRCNLSIGLLKDSPETIRKAVFYVLKYKDENL